MPGHWRWRLREASATARVDQPVAAQPLPVAGDILALLRCPCCGGSLALSREDLQCQQPACRQSFSSVNGIPVLIDPRSSLFSVEQYRDGSARILDHPQSRWARLMRSALPSLSHNFKGRRNFEWVERVLLKAANQPRLLIVGGATVGEGLERLLSNPAVTCIETDVAPGPSTSIICDGHRLPFADASMDGVVIQAVLEHVLDPAQCVAEIHRVLRPEGVIYCETPFIQQVHLGPYDFMRFTHGGLRYLLRDFDELGSGVVCGPGMALAWSYQYFLLSFVRSVAAQRIVRSFARITAFWLKYFDRLLGDSPGALDAASGFYFLGTKGQRQATGREVVARYQGLQRTMP